MFRRLLRKTIFFTKLFESFKFLSSKLFLAGINKGEVDYKSDTPTISGWKTWWITRCVTNCRQWNFSKEFRATSRWLQVLVIFHPLALLNCIRIDKRVDNELWEKVTNQMNVIVTKLNGMSMTEKLLTPTMK